MAMSPERIAHSISFLMGEVHALFIFSQTLARTHPSPDVLLPVLPEDEQAGLALVEGAPVPDAVVNGYQFAIEGIRKAVIAVAGNPQVPKTT